MVIRCLLWYNRLDFQQSHQATRLKANRRNFMMCSWAVGLVAKCFCRHWKPLWTEMRLCQRKKNPRMPPFILKTSEPQFVQDSGSSASLCPAHIPPIHTHTLAPGNQTAGWLELAPPSGYFGSRWRSFRRTTDRYWGLLRQRISAHVSKHWSPSLTARLWIFLPCYSFPYMLLPFPCCGQDALCSQVWLGAREWAGSSWLPELALCLRLLIFPTAQLQVMQPELVPMLIPHKPAWTGPAAGFAVTCLLRPQKDCIYRGWKGKGECAAAPERPREGHKDSHTGTSGTHAALMHGPSHPSCGSFAGTVLRQLCQR